MKNCGNKIKNMCGEKTYAACTYYELEIPTFSTLSDQDCVTIEETTADLYLAVGEVKDLSSLGNDCLTYVKEGGRNILKNILLKYEQEICDLKTKVDYLENEPQPYYYGTDYVRYTGGNLSCIGTMQGALMTDVIGQLNTYLCDLSVEVNDSSTLITVGSGTRVYRGVDEMGRKEIRSLVPINSIITIGASPDDREVQIGINSVALKSFIQANEITYSASNVGTGAGIYKQEIRTGDNIDFKFRKIKSTQTSFSIVESGDDIVITTDGSETKAQQGSGISLTGIGTFVSPYVITNTAPDQTVVLTPGTGISATGTYPSFTITNTAPDKTVVLTPGTGISATGTYPSFTITNTAPDQTVVITGGGATTVTGTYPNFIVSSTNNNTTYSAGTGLSLSGTTFSVQNLQKTIPAANYTLSPTDTEYTIFIENGSTPITITVPTGLPENFNVGFIQEGTGVVTFYGAGTTINTVNGLKIKGQNYQAFLEKKLATNTFYLLGNTIA